MAILKKNVFSFKSFLVNMIKVLYVISCKNIISNQQFLKIFEIKLILTLVIRKK